MKHSITIMLVLCTVSHSLLSQKLVVNEAAKTYQDIDNGNWKEAQTFHKGDTVQFAAYSVKEPTYLKIKDKSNQTSFIYRTSVNEVDDYFKKLRDKMDSERKFITTKYYDKIKMGDTVKMISARELNDGQWRFVKFTNMKGDTAESSLNDLQLNFNLENQAKILIGESNALINQERIKKLKAKYNPTTYAKIMKGQIWVGMTSEMLRDSKGRPKDINTSSSASGYTEQWVYETGTYVYLENGKVTSWQGRY